MFQNKIDSGQGIPHLYGYNLNIIFFALGEYTKFAMKVHKHIFLE